MTTEPQGAYMIWLPAGGAKSPPVGRDDRPRRALHPDGGQGDLPVRDADARVDGARRRSARPAWSPADIDLFIPHQANIRIIEAVAKGLDLPMDRMFVNLDRYGNTSAASVPIALAEAVNEGRVKVGDQIVIVAFGAGFTSRRGRHRVDRRPGPRHRRRRRRPTRADVHVRLPVDWDSVDPIPAALAEIDRPGRSRPGSTIAARRRRARRARRRRTAPRRSTHDRSDRQDRPSSPAARAASGGPSSLRLATQGADVAFTYRGNAAAAAETDGRRRGARPPGARDPGRRPRRRGRRGRRQGRARGVRQGRHPRQQRRRSPATT